MTKSTVQALLAVGTEGSTAPKKTAERPTTRWARPRRRFQYLLGCFFFSGGGCGQAIHRTRRCVLPVLFRTVISSTNKRDTAKSQCKYKCNDTHTTQTLTTKHPAAASPKTVPVPISGGVHSGRSGEDHVNSASFPDVVEAQARRPSVRTSSGWWVFFKEEVVVEQSADTRLCALPVLRSGTPPNVDMLRRHTFVVSPR